MRHQLESVIFDWAGTIVDFGSFAPTQIFVDAFKAAYDFDLTLAEARGPMGLGKWQHIEALGRDIMARERMIEPRREDWPEPSAERLAAAFDLQVKRSRHCTGLAGEVLIWRPSDHYGPAMLVAWEVLP